MSDSLFTDTGTPTPASDDNSVDALATQLFSIKNENGEPKYASLAEAVKALQHAQAYIPQLKNEKETYEQEVARLKAELDKRSSVEDVISRLTNRPPAEPTHTSDAPKALDEGSVLAMVQRELQQREQLTLTQANAKIVADAMTQKFGEKAKAEIAAKAQELGMTTKEMEAFAYSKPQAFLSWFNTSPSAPQGAAPVRSSVHLPEVPPTDGVKHPGRSMLRGVSSKDQAAFMAQIRAEVYKKHGIDS